MLAAAFSIGLALAVAPRAALPGGSGHAPSGDKKPRAKTDSRIHLIHTDVLYKNSREDARAEVLVGHVKLSHEGAVLDCDSAKFYREDNSFKAYGHVKMVQGDTLVLHCDTLTYEGFDMTAHARGDVELDHRKTRLVTHYLDYDRIEGVGLYYNGGTLYDADNVLTSDNGDYTPSERKAYFSNNVVLDNPKFKLMTHELYYNTGTKVANIVSESNIVTSDSTFIYSTKGDYDTQSGAANLEERSRIYNGMRQIEGDSLHYDKTTGVSEGYGHVVLNDIENLCTLKGGYCRYEKLTGTAVATDSAVAMEYSSPDTLYVHGDTLKMFTFNMETDSVYRNLYAYHKVRMFRNDFQGVCDSLVSLQRDSCTYLYGQPILWNENQQIFGEEIRVYNNDSTVDWIHVINQAMTVEQLDSVSYNQVSSKEMFSYFKGGEIEHNEARGNVYVCYFMDEDDGNRIGMVYSETTLMKLYMANKKADKIWMAKSNGVVYPELMIPGDKRYLANFAWFDYIRPLDKDDIFEWRGKDSKNLLKKSVKTKVPLQKLDDLQ